MKACRDWRYSSTHILNFGNRGDQWSLSCPATLPFSSIGGKKPWYPGWPHSWCEYFGEEKYSLAPARNQP